MDLIQKVVKKEIKQLERLKDTFDDRFDYLRLDKNERIIPFNEPELNKFKSNIKSEDISGYAELGPVYRKLASYLGVKVDQIFLASGSDLAIKSVYEACVEARDNIILHKPSFAMYVVYASMFGAGIKSIPIKKDWLIDVDRMLSSVDDKTKMMVIENPNGFIGTKPDTAIIEHCAGYLAKKDIILLLDEAYYYIENLACASHRLILKYPNIIISQTFSKCHGLAGARFGYLIGDPELIQYISRVRPMHEITGLTACAVNWILDHPDILKKYQHTIKESKHFLTKELDRLDIKHKDSHGNFILIHFPDSGLTKDMANKLKNKKILIRRPFEESYLKGWSRVTVGSLHDSEIFIKALKDILET